MEAYLSKNITSAAATTICSTGCILHTIVINEKSAHTAIITDGATTLGTLKADAAEGTYEYDMVCNNNLIITTATSFAGDITVTYGLQGS